MKATFRYTKGSYCEWPGSHPMEGRSIVVNAPLVVRGIGFDEQDITEGDVVESMAQWHRGHAKVVWSQTQAGLDLMPDPDCNWIDWWIRTRNWGWLSVCT